ncbi:MAG: anthrone oxygenase family protein [Pseudonocardiaceae bacterium]
MAAVLQRRLNEPSAARWTWAALGLYGVGFLTTMIINVPLNNQLADARNRRPDRRPGGCPSSLRDTMGRLERGARARLRRRPGMPEPCPRGPRKPSLTRSAVPILRYDAVLIATLGY